MSSRQQELLDREASVLTACREILVAEGYYGLTMERVASRSRCPKGTLYQHFTSKEDLVLAVALQGFSGRLEMMRGGAAYAGRSRERMAGVAEGAALFSHLHGDDADIMQMARGSMRERASAQRVSEAAQIEHDAVRLVRGILSDAVVAGELQLPGYVSVEQMTLALWALVEGGFSLVYGAVARSVLEVDCPVHELWMAYNVLADGYQWRPFFCEWDWEETLAEIRRTIFPMETQAVHGENAWYGDAGKRHPRETGFWPESALLYGSESSCGRREQKGVKKED